MEITLDKLLQFDINVIDSKMPYIGTYEELKTKPEDYLSMLIFSLKEILARIYDYEAACLYYIGKITAERRASGQKKLSSSELDQLKGLQDALHHKAKALEQRISQVYLILNKSRVLQERHIWPVHGIEQ